MKYPGLDELEEIIFGGSPIDVWEPGAEDDEPVCLYGIGDSTGLCTRARFGCYEAECPYANEDYQ